MPSGADPDALIDAIHELAMDVARLCPDCADKATRLVTLVGQLRGTPLDRGTIEDTLSSEVLDTDMSDLQVRRAADAVAKAAREGS